MAALLDRPRVKIDIQLDGCPNSAFSTLDTIRGEVLLSADADTHFDQVAISFTGTSRALIELSGVTAPTVGTSSAFHTFLRLVQPVESAAYPEPRVLEAGKSYSFPFTFVIPEQLLPYACNHDVLHHQTKADHVRLPPSLGDSPLLDDLAPEMVQIQYGVRVKVSKRGPDRKSVTLLERGRRVRVVPASEELAPLNVLDDSQEYRMRKEKDVKKGALRGKLGRMVVKAAQPKPFRLRQDQDKDQEHDPATTATVNLRFDPVDESQLPPRLGTLSSKLKANTWYATEPWADAPARSASLAWSHDRGVYVQTVSLATRCVASAQWTKHSGNSPAPSPSSSAACSRRGSVQSNCSDASNLSSSSHYTPHPASASYAGKTYYTTSIIVPVTLPKTKSFVPTFHSCLSARTYALDFCLSYHTPNTSLTAPNVSIRVPVQVMGPGTLHDASHIHAMSARQADEFFTPRTITAPPAEYTQRADLEATRGSINIQRESVRGVHRTASNVSANSFAAPPPEYSSLARELSNRPVVGTC